MMKFKQLVTFANSSVADFSMLDWSILKVTLMLSGVIIGCSFSNTCRSLRPILFALWLAGVLFTLKRVYNLPFFCCRGHNDKLTLGHKSPSYTDQAAE